MSYIKFLADIKAAECFDAEGTLWEWNWNSESRESLEVKFVVNKGSVNHTVSPNQFTKTWTIQIHAKGRCVSTLKTRTNVGLRFKLLKDTTLNQHKSVGNQTSKKIQCKIESKFELLWKTIDIVIEINQRKKIVFSQTKNSVLKFTVVE